LNGRAREALIPDRSLAVTRKVREKADPAKGKEVGAPIPGMLASLSVSVGQKVAKGAKVAVIEAMKMQTTVYAQDEGVVDAVPVEVGEQLDSKDLIARLR